MSYYRRQPQLEESYHKFLALLQQRLRDPDHDLPTGVVAYLLRDPNAEESELLAIRDNVSRQVAATTEPDPDLMRILAQLQVRVADFAAAAEILEGLWQRRGAEDLIYPLYALYARLERWQDAALLLEPLVEEHPSFRFFYIQVLGKLGRYDALMRQIDRFSASLPAASDRAPTPDAGSEVQAASSQWPGFGHLMREVAWDLRDRGQDAEAEQIFRRLSEQAPDDPELQAIVFNLYAGAEERQGHAEELADRWQQETDPNLLFEEGTQRLTAGDAAGAIDLLRRAAPEFPQLEAAWYNLGMAAYRLEDWATVESAFGRAGELNPARAQAFFFRGIALVELDRCGEAVKALERAVELDPGRALGHYYLSVCYRQLGDPAAAAAAQQRYEAARD